LYDQDGIFLSIRKGEIMKELWQTPGGKVDEGEIPIKAAIRKTEKETGIILKDKDLEYLFNDSEFNCNVYITKIPKDVELEQIEKDKNGPWIHFDFLKYEDMAKREKTTPTHTNFIDEILNRILWDTLPCNIAEIIQPEVENEKFTMKQQEEIDNLIKENESRFVTNISETGQSTKVGRTNVTQHRIDTKNADPIRRNYYRTTKEEQDFIDGEIKKMLKEGIIQESDSPWASPAILVKMRGKWQIM
jgi:ADP-ribose pyrophosphatase YjhB (NUDIX family)